MTSSQLRCAPAARDAVTLEAAVAELRAQRMIVLRSRDAGYGGIVFAGAHADSAKMSFAIRRSSGFLCVALPPARCDLLDIPPMCPSWHGRGDADFCVTVDASSGITTGISASDRARTARLLADPEATAEDFIRPGHVVPVATALSAGTPSSRLSPTAAELARLAGLEPVAVVAHVVSVAEPVQLATGEELAEFAAAHELAMLDLDTSRLAPSAQLPPHPVSRG